MSDAAEAMRDRLRTDLKMAMRARDAMTLSVIRSLLAAIDNAQAVAVDLSGPASAQRQFGDNSGEMARLALSVEALNALLEREAVDRADAAQEMQQHGRTDEVARLDAEAAIVRRYLA